MAGLQSDPPVITEPAKPVKKYDMEVSQTAVSLKAGTEKLANSSTQLIPIWEPRVPVSEITPSLLHQETQKKPE